MTAPAPEYGGPLRGGCVLMVGTSLETKGGVASIINCWRDVGLFERWNVRYIGSNGAGSSLRGVWLAVRCWLVCAWLMATARVRLVHVHHSSFVSFWRKTPVFALAMLLRKPLIVSLHGGAFRDFYRDLPMPVQWWARFIMRRCQRYVVLTESWRDWARSVEPRSRVAVIPNVAPEIPAVPPPYPPQRPAGQLLFIGRVEREKGVPDLVDALALAHRQGAIWKLVIGGVGDVDGTLERARAAGLPEGTVRCVGWIDSEAKAEHLRACSGLVLPSLIENMPVVLLEAFAHARPVIATQVGGVVDIVDPGKDGWIIAPGKPEDLAAAMVQMWQRPTEVLAAMGMSGRNKVQMRYSPAVVLANLESMYGECLGEEA